MAFTIAQGTDMLDLCPHASKRMWFDVHWQHIAAREPPSLSYCQRRAAAVHAPARIATNVWSKHGAGTTSESTSELCPSSLNEPRAGTTSESTSMRTKGGRVRMRDPRGRNARPALQPSASEASDCRCSLWLPRLNQYGSLSHSCSHQTKMLVEDPPAG